MTTVSAILGLAMVDVVYAFGGLRLLLARLARRRVASRSMARDQREVDAIVDRAEAAVNRAVMWYPRHAECLPRSIVLTHLLRRWGVAATMVIGIRAMPFYAHAWVEVDGRVVCEQEDVRGLYPAIERCEPYARRTA
jgi:Transglutaminase-like superfamily